MTIVVISKETAQAIYATRSIKNTYDRKDAKKRIFASIKSANGIPASTRLKINILNEDNPQYLQVRNKRTGVALTNSLPEPTIAMVQGASVANAAKAEVKTVPVKKAALPKAPTLAKAPAKPVAKTPAVKATKPAKATTKPTPAKPVTKVAAEPTPAAKAAVTQTLGSPTKTGKFQLEVRTSIAGKRVRLGFASSEKMKAQMIANAKAA